MAGAYALWRGWTTGGWNRVVGRPPWLCSQWMMSSRALAALHDDYLLALHQEDAVWKRRRSSCREQAAALAYASWPIASYSSKSSLGSAMLGRAGGPAGRRLMSGGPARLDIKSTAPLHLPMPDDRALGLAKPFFPWASARPKVLKGQYLLGRVLGAGAFGQVWAAKDLAAEPERRVVAIKAMPKTRLLSSLAHATSYLREIAAMRRFRHPYITRLYEVLHDRDTVYLVMEFVPGRDLRSVMGQARSTFGGFHARRLFQQMTDAVDFCHSRGVFHRDIKPHNVLLSEAGDAKVCDFGVAALRGDDFGSATPDGLLRGPYGTPAFAAPETLSPERREAGYAGAPADVWALGCSLYVMVTLRLPFVAPFRGGSGDQQRQELVRLILAGQYKMPKYIPPPAADFLRRCLEPDPTQRITIPQMHQHPWFAEGYTPPDFTHYHDDDRARMQEVEAAFAQSQIATAATATSSSAAPAEPGGVKVKPRRLSAFELVVPSLDVSKVVAAHEEDDYERLPKGDLVRFSSLLPAKEILQATQTACTSLGFAVQTRDFKLKITAPTSGRQGVLTITAEIVKVAKGVFLVEVQRAAGDHLEFHQFLKDLAEALTGKIDRVPN